MELNQTIAKLRQLTSYNVQHNWRFYPQDLPTPPNSTTIESWPTAPVNHQGYITWSAGSQVRWLGQKFIVPNSLNGYPLANLSLRLVLTWWSEDTKIFINGQLVQEGDLFDSSARVLLTTAAVSQAEILVQLRLVSPGHDIGALMASQCIYEHPSEPEPGFVADELTVLSQYLQTFAPEKLDFLNTQLTKIDWNNLSNPEIFNNSLCQLRRSLQPLSHFLKQRRLHLLGHAHLDMAWLWTVEETYEVAQRTFQSVLNLQEDFPSLTFCHSTPALYAWLEKHRPQLFQAIQQAVREGKWEIVGPMWVEPELNLVGGESLIRQLLYGQLYCEEKFGTIIDVAWLPDSFGFSWQLPQIFKQAGIEYFVTGKLHWNDTTTFPHGLFWWQSPDGTRLLTLMSPPNVAGVMDTNPISMANYAVSWEQTTGLKDAFWLPGVGDHGGGPSRDMLEVQQRWQNSPFFPKMEFTTARKYLTDLTATIAGSSNLESIPIWNDELYLELHRGCYTTHAEQKFCNRYCEGLLYGAELFSSLVHLLWEKRGLMTPIHPLFQYTVQGTVCQGELKKIQAKIQEAWQKVLFNQFHDILPGTSIGEVFLRAKVEWQEVIAVGEEILENALKAIADQIQLPPPPRPEAKPMVIFNPLSWRRSQVVSVPVSGNNWQVYNLEGELVPSQTGEELLFWAEDVGAIGYSLFWLSHTEIQTSTTRSLSACPEGRRRVVEGLSLLHREEGEREFVLENEKLRVVVNPHTGDLSSIWDKIEGREVLGGPGNQLQAFQDQGQYWDAWNIDPNYEQYPLPPTKLQSIEWLEVGLIRNSIRVVRQLNKSQFIQDYVLEIYSPSLKIVTTVEWQESHVLVKAAFPLNLERDFATYEIPCGVIERPTKPNTPAEKAKWEVSALHWADLSNNEYGVSLLNNCKYGYDSKPNQLRLTLLKSPSWPDPEADRGKHQFTYSLYPHGGNWKSARTVNHGYELNLPLMVVLPEKCQGELPPASELLNLGNDNLILIALKPAEKEEGWILRCYESGGEAVELNLEGDLGLEIDHSVDLLERPLLKEDKAIAPWKIASFKL